MDVDRSRGIGGPRADLDRRVVFALGHAAWTCSRTSCLERARDVLWLITGADKVDAPARLRPGDHSIPADRISTANALVIADEAAAGGAAR